MSPRRITFALFAALALATARADITLSTGAGHDRASMVAGFKIDPGAAGLTGAGDEKTDALPSDRAALRSVTLTARDTPSSPNTPNSTGPLYLKIYDSRERTRLLGVSMNALRWNPPAGVAFGEKQTYAFENTTIPMKGPVWFALETGREAAAPSGAAGIMVTKSSASPKVFAMLVKGMKEFPEKVPALTLELKEVPEASTATPAETGSTHAAPVSRPPVILGGLLATILVAGAVATFAFKRKKTPGNAKAPAPSGPGWPLPPPPGQ